jgi:hypothetical protein
VIRVRAGRASVRRAHEPGYLIVSIGAVVLKLPEDTAAVLAADIAEQLPPYRLAYTTVSTTPILRARKDGGPTCAAPTTPIGEHAHE